MRRSDRKTIYVVVAFLLIAIAFFLVFLLNGTENHIGLKKEEETITALYCKAPRIEDAFFISNTANNTSHEIKITLRDDSIDKVFYVFSGVYRSNDLADIDEAHLHAKYNDYMGSNNQDHESLFPTYSIIKSKLTMSLYVDNYNMINDINSVFFFIDKDKIEAVKSYSIEEIKEYYEKKSFDCEIKE